MKQGGAQSQGWTTHINGFGGCQGMLTVPMFIIVLLFGILYVFDDYLCYVSMYYFIFFFFRHILYYVFTVPFFHCNYVYKCQKTLDYE